MCLHVSVVLSFCCWVALYCIYSNCSVMHSLMSIWVVSSLGAIINETAMNVLEQVFFKCMFLFFLDQYLAVELLSHRVYNCNFRRYCQRFCQIRYINFTHLSPMYKVSNCYKYVSILNLISLLKFSYSISTY